ncbi:MAG: hypothetical protein Q9213_003201 [Squamulea squamosa]
MFPPNPSILRHPAAKAASPAVSPQARHSHMPPGQSNTGQNISKLPVPFSVGPPPTFSTTTAASKQLPSHAARWLSTSTARDTGPVLVSGPPVDESIPAVLRPGNQATDTRTDLAETKADPRCMPERSAVRLTQTNAMNAGNWNPSMQRAVPPAADSPSITILSGTKPSSNVSQPLPNTSAMNFPFEGWMDGMHVYLDGPWWDNDTVKAPSGHSSYLTTAERRERRTRRREARQALRRYGAPEWLAQDSESED